MPRQSRWWESIIEAKLFRGMLQLKQIDIQGVKKLTLRYCYCVSIIRDNGNCHEVLPLVGWLVGFAAKRIWYTVLKFIQRGSGVPLEIYRIVLYVFQTLIGSTFML